MEVHYEKAEDVVKAHADEAAHKGHNIKKLVATEAEWAELYNLPSIHPDAVSKAASKARGYLIVHGVKVYPGVFENPAFPDEEPTA